MSNTVRSLQKKDGSSPEAYSSQETPSNPADPKSVTALSRLKEFQGECLVVKKDKLFCSACREELALKKSTITNHIGGVKHKKSKEALEKRQAREQDIATFLSVYDEEVEPKGSASVSMDTRVYRVRVLEQFLKSGIPMIKIDLCWKKGPTDSPTAHIFRNTYQYFTLMKRRRSKMRLEVEMFLSSSMGLPGSVRH